jgi:membrane-associated phospholipid phosphatase
VQTSSSAPATPTRARPGPALATVLGALVVVALLGWAVAAEWAPLLQLDRTVSTALYAGDDRPRLVEVALQVATAPGLSVVRGVVLLPVLVWLVLRRAWWTAAWVLVAAATISPLTSLLKELVGRARPQFAEGGARYETLSFPSGHSSGIACLATIGLVLAWPLLAPAARRAWLAAGVALVLLVGLTRMLLGVHFLSDVVGGWSLGLGWTLVVALAFGALPGGRSALAR